EALRRSEASFRSLAESLDDAVMRLDREHRHLYVNRVIEAQTGIPAEEFIGKTHAELGFPPEFVETCESALDRVFATGEPERIEFRLPTGTWIEATVAPECDDGGVISTAILTGRDITERRAREEALRRATHKFSLLSQITRHDILNTVTVLGGYLDLLAGETGRTEQGDAYLDACTTALDTIEDQIQFSRDYQELGLFEPRWQDPAPLLEGCRERMIPPETALDVSIDLPPVEISADPLLERVFCNLVQNTLRHAEGATRLSVTAKEADGDLVITFTDDGPGIPDSLKDAIFRPTLGSRHGHGLFLVSEILDLTGISIAERGTPGEGARFEIRVPADRWRVPDGEEQADGDLPGSGEGR
ncbi:MAG: ATP-binding protein, partial [Methanomicrobiales archaeon]